MGGFEAREWHDLFYALEKSLSAESISEDGYTDP